MLRGHFKSALVCTASNEYVMGKEDEICGDAGSKGKIGRWRIRYGKLQCRAKSIILAWNRTQLWGRCLCLVAQGMGGGSNRRSCLQCSENYVILNWKISLCSDIYFFFFFSRLEIKWSAIELHKTSSCAHENVGTGGKDRWECGAIICTGVEVGPETRWGERCLQATVNTS